MTAEMPPSRGRRSSAYHLLTPPNRYPSRLAGWAQTTVFKLATPRTGTARFGQYLLELGPGGGASHPIDREFEHFLLALDGEAVLGEIPLHGGSYAYLPPGPGVVLTNPPASAQAARVMWIKRRYEPALDLPAPAVLQGRIDAATTVTTPAGVRRRELLPPDDPAFDFSVSLLRFPPGAELDQVEVHDEEHGLYMTAGAGLYHLDGADLDVVEGDFIYMAPYCPQFFRPDGQADAEYLLYKDVFRDGF
jgi:(S)-ureidoglycine aminohydrolase